MNPTVPIEQRLLEAIRLLAPEGQQAVLDFAEFLQNRQPIDTDIQQVNESAPTAIDKGPIALAERGISPEQAG